MNRRTRRRLLRWEVIVSDPKETLRRSGELLDRAARWDALLGIGAEREAIAKAVAEERAAVVAWLRERQPGWPAGSGGHADAIERGEHRRKEER